MAAAARSAGAAALLLPLLALLCALHTDAQALQADPVRAALQDAGATTFLTLLPVAGVTTADLAAGKANFTLLVPSNQAFDAFLARMNLSLTDMKQRPSLAAAVVGYHILPGVRGSARDTAGYTRAKPLSALTADGTYALRFWAPSPGRVSLEDVHGAVANITRADIDAGRHVMVHVIDRVMRNGDVFFTVDEALEVHPEFGLIDKAMMAAGLDSEPRALRPAANTITIFAPTDAAMRAAQPALAQLSAAQLRDSLSYHILPGAYPIPAGFRLGAQSLPTLLAGRNLTVKLLQASAPRTNDKGETATAQVLDVELVPQGGAVAGLQPGLFPQVVLANHFANRYIIHGIDGVLLPKAPPAGARPAVTAAAAAAAPPPAAAAKPGTGSANNTRSTRALLAAHGGGSSSSSSRALMQFRSGSPRGQFAVSSVSMTDTQVAIRAAADGRTGVRSASIQGLRSSQAATVACWNCVSKGMTGTYLDG